jgi:hypothetical protein
MKNTLPKYSLANSLYRGRLPSKFANLSWVVVVSIDQSICNQDEQNAQVFKGNTCAFEMNIIWFASRTRCQQSSKCRLCRTRLWPKIKSHGPACIN